MKTAYFYDSSAGKIGIAENGSSITNVFFGNTVQPKQFEIGRTKLLDEAAAQLFQYLDKERTVFDLPLEFEEGTAFERSIWKALETIPYGKTKSYGMIAAQIGKPAASRAVGRAIGRNPLSIFVPCHRVIGTNGKLTGYAGGLEMKKALLHLEGIL